MNAASVVACVDQYNGGVSSQPLFMEQCQVDLPGMTVSV